MLGNAKSLRKPMVFIGVCCTMEVLRGAPSWASRAGFHLDYLFKAENVTFLLNSCDRRRVALQSHEIMQGLCVFLSSPTVWWTAETLRNPMVFDMIFMVPDASPNLIWPGSHLEQCFKAEIVTFRAKSTKLRQVGLRDHQIWQGLCMFLRGPTHVADTPEPCAIQWFCRWIEQA